MSTREDLEASLRARPDDATLGVYADFLQAEGDPRGELIALDLRPASMSMQSVEVRRGQLLRAWLDDDVDIAWDADQQLWYAGDLDTSYATFDCGFVDLVVDSRDVALARLLRAPAGTYLRRISLRGTREVLSPMLADIAERPRPWLTHLAITRTGGSSTVLGHAVGERLVEATQNLEVLDLAGENLFDRFVHPNVRELGLVGCDALDLVDGPPFKALTSIDFKPDDDQPVPRGLFHHDRVPALRRLNCSRAEPGGARMFELLGTVAIAPQLTHLVLPSIRTHRDHALVQAAISRMPVLREIVFARAYAAHGRFDDLAHPSARVQSPMPYPWQPREAYDALTSIDGCTVDIGELVSVLEEQYDTLREELKSFWHQFWYQSSLRNAVNAAELADGLDALPLTPRLAWLRDHLREEVADRGGYLAVVSRA